jgi:hypothetical protein
MDAAGARDHLQMVDGIMRTTDRTVHMPPAILLSIGFITTTVLALMQARLSGIDLPADPYLQMPAALVMFGIIGLVAWRGRHAPRALLVDSYVGGAFLVAFIVAMTLNVTAQHRVIPADGVGLIWAAVFAGALLFSGLLGSRPMLAGGAAMLIATGVAAYNPDRLVGILALGWFLGFVVPGLVLALRAPDGRTAAV